MVNVMEKEDKPIIKEAYMKVVGNMIKGVDLENYEIKNQENHM